MRFGQRRREFVVRVEDQDAQVRPRFDRLAQQQCDGGRLADAGRADDREVAVQRFVDRDAGVDRLVLRKLPDDDRAAACEVVDRGQVAGADAVCDRADIGIVGDAAVEDRLAIVRIVANLADQLDADLDGVAAAGCPLQVGFVDCEDQADRARRLEIDRHHLADRPQAGDRSVLVIGVGGDDGARAIALHDVAEHAVVGLCRSAPFLRGDFSAGDFPVNIHQWLVPTCPASSDHSGRGLSSDEPGWCRNS